MYLPIVRTCKLAYHSHMQFLWSCSTSRQEQVVPTHKHLYCHSPFHRSEPLAVFLWADHGTSPLFTSYKLTYQNLRTHLIKQYYSTNCIQEPSRASTLHSKFIAKTGSNNSEFQKNENLTNRKFINVQTAEQSTRDQNQRIKDLGQAKKNEPMAKDPHLEDLLLNRLLPDLLVILANLRKHAIYSFLLANLCRLQTFNLFKFLLANLHKYAIYNFLFANLCRHSIYNFLLANLRKHFLFIKTTP